MRKKLKSWLCQKPSWLVSGVIIFILCAIYIGVGYSFVSYEEYPYAIIPLVLLGILLFYFQLDKILYFVAFLTPLSINMLIGEETNMTIPTEPLLVVFVVVYIIKFFVDSSYDKRVLRHPITLALAFYVMWMIITSFYSVRMLVSFKYTLSKLLYIISFYIAVMPCIKDRKQIKVFYSLYATSLLFVVIYASIRFVIEGSDFQNVFFLVQPFYNDHTAYGAILAMFFTLGIYFSTRKGIGAGERTFFILLTFFYLLGLVLSYSRAAWISIVVMLGVYCIMKFKIKAKYILSVVIFGSLIFVLFQNTIIQDLSKNSQDSSANIGDHITSMSNISTDASNVERLNRWACAFRMFADSPFVGFGPGTYQFEYSAYQKSFQLSTISTNEGNLGNSHSEYFGPLAESGVLGMASVILLFALVIYTGIKVYKRAEDKSVSTLALFITLALITYYFHGFLNDFLDTDKLSVPFWFLTACIVSLDIYYPKNGKYNQIKPMS